MALRSSEATLPQPPRNRHRSIALSSISLSASEKIPLYDPISRASHIYLPLRRPHFFVESSYILVTHPLLPTLYLFSLSTTVLSHAASGHLAPLKHFLSRCSVKPTVRFKTALFSGRLGALIPLSTLFVVLDESRGDADVRVLNCSIVVGQLFGTCDDYRGSRVTVASLCESCLK